MIFLNEELDDIMKIVTPLEDAGLLIKGVSETVENKVKEQKEGFLGMIAANLGASLLRNLVARKRIKSKIPEREATIPGLRVTRTGEVTIAMVKE